jgi:NAD(P)-dependent dehydrogenase (short-subunit alcohol dehydrogenase family)
MMRLAKEVAIVTGGSRGLGRAIVERFVAEGAGVMTCDIEKEAGERAVEEINGRYREHGTVSFMHADVGDRERLQQLVERTVERFGAPTILVNNAAVVIFRHPSEASVEEFEASMRVNVQAYWWLSRLVYPHMEASGRGSIVNIASTHPYQTKPGTFPYNVTKGAILAMNKALAVDFGSSGVRVNALLPGIVDTRPTRDWLAGFLDPEAKRREVLATHPLNRMPTEEEIAGAALFLASPDSFGMTGAELVVDCGRQAMRP